VGVGWSLGVFNPADNPRNDDGGDRLAITGRVFGAPIQRDGRVLHLGAAYSDRNLDQPVEASGFELDVAETGGQLDSSAITIDDDRQWGLEALYLHGPFSLQGELFRRDMSGAGGGPDGDVTHHYLQATWTLTGESRGYRPAEGVPDMVAPAGRRGALELIAKVDRIRFDLDGQDDQKVDGYLIGANWYATRNVKLMLNLIRLSSDAVVAATEDDEATIVSTRIQVAF
jgi:phosphate-selective porin OprO/OprP